MPLNHTLKMVNFVIYILQCEQKQWMCFVLFFKVIKQRLPLGTRKTGAKLMRRKAVGWGTRRAKRQGCAGLLLTLFTGILWGHKLASDMPARSLFPLPCRDSCPGNNFYINCALDLRIQEPEDLCPGAWRFQQWTPRQVGLSSSVRDQHNWVKM